MTINYALPGDTPDYYIIIIIIIIIVIVIKVFLLIKARTCYQVSMYLRVFLVANHFRLRLRRTRDVRCSRTWELHQLYILFFGDGTYSKGDPSIYTLDFYIKVQVWGREFHYKIPYAPKAILVEKNE